MSHIEICKQCEKCCKNNAEGKEIIMHNKYLLLPCFYSNFEFKEEHFVSDENYLEEVDIKYKNQYFSVKEVKDESFEYIDYKCPYKLEHELSDWNKK